MHLLVLSAFRPDVLHEAVERLGVSMHLLVLSAFRLGTHSTCDNAVRSLNAPFGAQCFPTVDLEGPYEPVIWLVSMHLLVLSAFRHDVDAALAAENFTSQCTFWCSVLSDSASRKPRRNAVSRDENAADLESTKSNRLAPLQLNHTTAENRHKSTQRRQHPLPIGTPPAFNEPTPKDRSLATPPR